MNKIIFGENSGSVFTLNLDTMKVVEMEKIYPKLSSIIKITEDSLVTVNEEEVQATAGDYIIVSYNYNGGYKYTLANSIDAIVAHAIEYDKERYDYNKNSNCNNCEKESCGDCQG